MKKIFATGILAATMFAGGSCTPDDSIHQAAEQSVQQFEEAGVQNMENDALFIAEAASANRLMVELSQLASGHAVSPEVKELAQQLHADHSEVIQEINQIAEQGPFILPETLGDAHQKVYEDVSSRTGLQLDLAYIKEALENHESLLKRYEDIANNGVSMDVKQFASKQIPLARQHLQIVEELQNKVNNI